MREVTKQTMKANILPLTAALIGLASVAGVMIGDVISVGAAAVWSLLWIISCLFLLQSKFERVIYPCLIVLMAFTAECSMQLQIQHTFELSLSYQRIIDFCIYCIFFAFFGAVSKRKSTGLIVGNIFFYIVASLNLALTVFRGKPVYFPDIYSAKTALDFASEYSFPLSKVHLICAISVFSCVLYCLVFRRKMTDMNGKIIKRTRNAVCIMLIPVLSVLLHIPTVFHFRGYFFSTTEYWLYSFCMSAYQMNIEEPKAYDPETVPIKETSDTAVLDTQMPNVLFIMNESFADLRVISSFEEGDSAMPFFDELSQRDDVARGNMYVSIYGGNTANTEFEVLTGVSMYILPYDTTAYNLYVNSETMSLASYFNNLGYRTIAFHPSAKTNYNRNNVYPNLGFQEAYFQENFSDLDTLRTFTSDVSNYEKVIEFFEKKNADERLFFFNLTVQNHGPFNFYDDKFENKVAVANEAFSSTQQFLSCLKYSDEALEMLLEYLDTYPEPVAVVFFGDHQAKIDDAFYEMLYGKSLSELSDEEREKQYIVPYMIWTNYQLALEDNVNMSANYLGVYVIEQLGLPQTGYQKFLNSLRQEYPVITAQSIGTDMSTAEFSDSLRLEAYENCCYNLLFDKDNLWDSIYTNIVCDSEQ